MTIEVDEDAGVSVTTLTNNGIDVCAGIAKLKGINPEALLFRLNPTNPLDGGKLSFRAIWQDSDALADAGTPTCVSWMNIEDLVYGGESLNEFLFELDADGRAELVEIPDLRATLKRVI
jgi:hypothetical protein